jgi:hypothetical protein
MLKRVAVSVVAVGTAAVVWAGSASGTTGSQRFSISATNAGGSVYASGPISGSGRDVTLSQNLDRFVFPGGSVWVSHQASSQHQTFDPRSCLGRFTESGNYQLVKGTGVYRGVTGSGTYSARGTSRGCNPETAPAHYFVTATGWTSLP